MSFTDLYNNYGLLTIISISLAAFVAGFIDAVVGGGGLIQTPFLLLTFPQTPLPVLFGTNKIAALAGTTIAAVKYSKQITFNYTLLVVISLSCIISSFCGAQLVSQINTNTLKPVILIILILIAVFTFIKKDLGAAVSKNLSLSKQIAMGSAIGLIVGFYDGFFGPGTGSFFVLGFVVILGFDFLKASAYAKVVNCVTNVSALFVFISKGFFILPLAIVMAIFNILGSYIGSHLALKRGNAFIRIVFLIIVSVMIVRYGYEVLYSYYL